MSEVKPRNVTTPVLGLNQPLVGGDVDEWGDLLNANAGVLDQALLTTGGTMTGNLRIETDSPLLSVSADSGPAAIELSRQAGQPAEIFTFTGPLARWAIVLGTGAAETGGNAGSNFELARFNDAGGFIDHPIFIDRATGVVTINLGAIINGTLTVSGLPTTKPAAGSGIVWNNGGVLCVA